MREHKYRVEVIEDKTGKVISTIGKNLSKRKADKREEIGWNRINVNDFSIRVIDEETNKEVFE